MTHIDIEKVLITKNRINRVDTRLTYTRIKSKTEMLKQKAA